MKGKLFAGLAVALAVSAVPAIAQTKPKKVQIAVKDFEFGTIAYHWWGDADIGKGVADLIVNEVVNEGSLSAIERKSLDTVLAEQDFANSNRADTSAAKQSKIGKVKGVRYIITGSITKFGGEEKNYGGGGLVKGKLGGLGLKKAKTEVTLTARLIDTSTGDIVVSSQGHGESHKGGGLSFGGAGGGGGAGFSMASSNYKESAIGEATELAVKQLVATILTHKGDLEP